MSNTEQSLQVQQTDNLAFLNIEFVVAVQCWHICDEYYSDDFRFHFLGQL